MWYRVWRSLKVAHRKGVQESHRRVLIRSQLYHTWANIMFGVMLGGVIDSGIERSFEGALLGITISAHAGWQYEIHWQVTEWWLALLSRMKFRKQVKDIDPDDLSRYDSGTDPISNSSTDSNESDKS